MAFTVTCPPGGMNVLVTNMTICVKGSCPIGEKQGTHNIRLKVVKKGDPAPNPAAGGTDVATGAKWCARNVPVPGNGNLTLYAWEELFGSSGSTWGPPKIVDFVGGGANPIDCCSGCTQASALVGELAASPTLEFTIPGGRQAGRYPARPSGPLAWSLSVGGINYELRCDPAPLLVQRDRSLAVPCSSFDGTPFSATFPGAIFDSPSEIVVTLA